MCILKYLLFKSVYQVYKCLQVYNSRLKFKGPSWGVDVILKKACAIKHVCSRSLCFSRTVRVKRLSLGLHRQQWASVSFGADPEDAPADAGVVLESLEVLQNLQCVTQGCVMLFGLIYALNLNYPKDLKCTFEAFQKIIMQLDATKLSQSHPLVSNNCNHIQYLWIFVQVILLSFVQKWPYFCLPQVCVYLRFVSTSVVHITTSFCWLLLLLK